MKTVECTSHFVLHFALLASEELFFEIQSGLWKVNGWKKYGKNFKSD